MKRGRKYKGTGKSAILNWDTEEYDNKKKSVKRARRKWSEKRKKR